MGHCEGRLLPTVGDVNTPQWVLTIPHSGLQREVTVGSKKGSQPPSTKASGKGFREGMAHRRRDPGNGLPCNETVIELSRVLQYSLRFT